MIDCHVIRCRIYLCCLPAGYATAQVVRASMAIYLSFLFCTAKGDDEEKKRKTLNLIERFLRRKQKGKGENKKKRKKEFKTAEK